MLCSSLNAVLHNGRSYSTTPGMTTPCPLDYFVCLRRSCSHLSCRYAGVVCLLSALSFSC
jgi:hypothetical protein